MQERRGLHSQKVIRREAEALMIFGNSGRHEVIFAGDE
jgi:hypothetical protein